MARFHWLCATATIRARPDSLIRSGIAIRTTVAEAVVAQQYPPDDLVGRDYYQPSGHGAERELGERLGTVRRVIRSADNEAPPER